MKTVFKIVLLVLVIAGLCWLATRRKTESPESTNRSGEQVGKTYEVPYQLIVPPGMEDQFPIKYGTTTVNQRVYDALGASYRD